MVTGERSSSVRSKRTKNLTTDLREQKEVRSAVTTTTPTHDRSVVRNDVVDDNHYLDPRQALADTNDRKTAVPDRKSRHEKPMYYDLGQKTLGYEEFCGRIIPASDLYNVVSNYAYALFGIGTLCSGGTTHGGRVRRYKCGCCNLKIRFDRQTNVDSEDTFFVLDVDSFPRCFLDRTHGGTSPHRELCTKPESTLIKHPFVVLNHPFLFECYQAFLPLNSVTAVHLKSQKIVNSIQQMFERVKLTPTTHPSVRQAGTTLSIA